MTEIDAETALSYGMIALLMIFVCTIIAIIFHSGILSEVIISTCKPYIGEITVAYKFARGPYKESGALFTEAHTLLPHYRTLGVYYDDPRKKEASHLRYIVGLIISESGNPIKVEDEAVLRERGFSFATFPEIQHAVQTTFPFNSTISIIVAVFRVYPLLNQYIESRKLCAHPFLEIYDADETKIYFIGPLEKQDDFYVPEVKLDIENKQAEEEDDKSSISWDDSASLIRSDAVDVDSESVGDDSMSISNVTNRTIAHSTPEFENNFNLEPDAHIEVHVEAIVASINEPALNIGDESDHSIGSSFEEIDDKEAPEPVLNESNSKVPISATADLKTEL